MTPTPSPPAWADFALRAFLTRRDFESVSGDLLEEYRQNVYGMRGSLRANLWYVSQVLGFAWRRAGLWATLFAIAFLARTAMDWHLPTTDFQTRSGISTLVAVGIFLAAGFWAGFRSGSFAAGGVMGFSAASVALPIQLAGAALLLAVWHDPSIVAAIRASGGIEEVFTLPSLTILPAIVFGAIGGALGARIRRLRGSPDSLSS